MTSAEMRNAVESVKQKERRHALPPGRKAPVHPVRGISAYEEGVEMAHAAVEVYKKALEKIK